MKVGVAGLNAAGKGEVVRILERRGFYPASLSDVIRDDLEREGIAPLREHMIERGRALRERYGPGVLAERIARQLPVDRNHVVDSIRHPAEVEVLRATGAFVLLWIDASPEVRFGRASARARPGDPVARVEFEALQSREMASEDPAAAQLARVREMADAVLPNEEDLATLEARVVEAVRHKLAFEARPGWDEYFMSIARVVATRSNCVKRKVGALLVLERRIISTGYNGTPRGTRNCNEGGCPRCNEAAESGRRLDECLCSHAEENSITQAAYHGVSVRGATIYSTFHPCLMCTKMIINAGIVEVVFESTFPLADVSLQLLDEAGVRVRSLR